MISSVVFPKALVWRQIVFSLESTHSSSCDICTTKLRAEETWRASFSELPAEHPGNDLLMAEGSCNDTQSSSYMLMQLAGQTLFCCAWITNKLRWGEQSQLSPSHLQCYMHCEPWSLWHENNTVSSTIQFELQWGNYKVHLFLTSLISLA